MAKPTLSKMGISVRPYRFTWMREISMKTVVSLFDGSQSFVVKPDETMQVGIEFEKTEPKKITQKEAQQFVSKGAYIFELTEDDKLEGVAVVKF